MPPGVEALENERPLGVRRERQRRRRAHERRGVLIANPDAVAEPGAVAALRDFMEAHPRCGVAGPADDLPRREPAASRRRFPTVGGTIVRRTPLRRSFPPLSGSATTTSSTSGPDEPVQADWMLGGFLLLRRAMLDELGGFDPGFRLYGEDIDLSTARCCAGWERWYVPAAVVRHEHEAVTDRRFLTRRTLWHWRGILRFVRKHPERLRALDDLGEVRQPGGGLHGAEYADPGVYLARSRELVGARARARPGDAVLDLGCGDGGLADFLPGQRYVGVDANAEMVAAGLALGREIVEADLNAYVPAGPVEATTIFRAIYYATDRRAAARARRRLHRPASSSSTSTRGNTALPTYGPTSRRRDSIALATHPFFVPQTRAPSPPAFSGSSGAGRLRGRSSASGSRSSVRPWRGEPIRDVGAELPLVAPVVVRPARTSCRRRRARRILRQARAATRPFD